MFAGHIKVLGGPHVARGPDVAQACSRSLLEENLPRKTIARHAKAQVNRVGMHDRCAGRKRLFRVYWQCVCVFQVSAFHWSGSSTQQTCVSMQVRMCLGHVYWTCFCVQQGLRDWEFRCDWRDPQGDLCSSLYGLVKPQKVNQSSIPNIYLHISLINLFTTLIWYDNKLFIKERRITRAMRALNRMSHSSISNMLSYISVLGLKDICSLGNLNVLCLLFWGFLRPF